MRTLRTILIFCAAAMLLLSGCGKNQADPIPTESAATIPEEIAESIPIETVVTDSFSMNYFKFGQGEKTFVILPGISVQGVMGSAEQVALGYETMTEDFTIYVFDPRNELPASYSISEMAEDTAEVFRIIGLDHIYVMGASMGGMVAMEIAANHPELIEKMVLASTAVQMKEEQCQSIDEWIRLAQEGDTQALYLSFGEDIYPQEVFEQARDLLIEASKTVTEDELKHFVILAESLKGFDITNDLEKIACPILAISDTEDHVLGAEAVQMVETYMSQRPDWDFYLYEGYGHAVYDTAPDFKERMLQFFLED